MKSNLDIAKKIIKEYYYSGDSGIFNTRNVIGDFMTNLYKDDDLCIDICYRYEYFEVFGLSENEFAELKKFYENKCK